VAQEALLAGRALVATSVGGVPALVGDAAVLVPRGDVAALTSAVDRLLGDLAARAQLEESALRRAKQFADAAEVGRRVAAVYDEPARS
jgi:glycosyltransferase involved in cell wall biosynthesis